MSEPICDRCNELLAQGGGYAVYTGARQGIGIVSMFVSSAGSDGEELGAMMYCDRCADEVFAPAVWRTAKEETLRFDAHTAHNRDTKSTRRSLIDAGIALIAKRRGLTPTRAKTEAKQLGGLWWHKPSAVALQLAQRAQRPRPIYPYSRRAGECFGCSKPLERGIAFHLRNETIHAANRYWEALGIIQGRRLASDDTESTLHAVGLSTVDLMLKERQALLSASSRQFICDHCIRFFDVSEQDIESSRVTVDCWVCRVCQAPRNDVVCETCGQIGWVAWIGLISMTTVGVTLVAFGATRLGILGWSAVAIGAVVTLAGIQQITKAVRSRGVAALPE